MGRRMMGRLAAGVATGLLGPVAHGQPEYVRIDPGGNVNFAVQIDVDGDVMAWSETPGPPQTGITTHIYRRTGAGWGPEAEIRTTSPFTEYGAVTAVDGDRVAMRAGQTGLRVWRHESGQWIQEPIGSNDLREYGEHLALDGPWLAIPLRAWGQWNRPRVLMYHFDGAKWRAHSRLEAPTVPYYYPVWIAIEGNLLAVSGQQGVTYPDPAPVIVFRLEGDQWRHEATLPLDTRVVAINEGRVATVGAEGLLIYAESTPGVWEIESVVPGVKGWFSLDGDSVAAVERQVAAHLWFEGRAVVYRRRGAGWERTGVLYPSNTYSMEFGAFELPYGLSIYSPIEHVDGEVFAVTAEGESWDFEWRIVGFPACRADFNGDGVADMRDLLAFLEGREQGMMSADYDMDGMIGWPGAWDEGDFLEFMRLLEEGC